ncbi:MAG: hypothetical protein DI534_16035 [Leifsonia xyli]|nr:MAG: hypothetical protein DI534_16035 [Leifsonia xyli]
MKTIVVAAVVLLSSIAAANAGVGPSNSTNQHLRDSADFYDNIPDIGALNAGRADVTSIDRSATGQNRQIGR